MGDVYRVTLQTRVDDKVSSIQLHYEQTGGTTGAQAAKQCADSVVNALTTVFRAILSTSTLFQGVTAKRIKPLPGLTGISPANDLAGTVTGTALPALCCLVLNLRNGSGDLPRPGRLFISGCSKGSLDAGHWLTGFLTGPVNDFGIAIKQIAAGGDGDFSGDLVVPRYVVAGVPTRPPDIVPVNAVDFAIEPGRQIRRKSKMIGG